MSNRNSHNRSSHHSARRHSRQELVLYTRLKAVLCMVLFALAVVVCVKVIQNLGNQGSVIAKSPETQPAPVSDNTEPEKRDDDSKADDPDKLIVTKKEKDDPPDEDESSSDEQEDNKDRAPEHKKEVIDGITYIDGILVANKSYSLPSDYNPGLDPDAEAAFYEMAADAANDGISLFICSGFRSYWTQTDLYNGYVWSYGKELTDTFSARPGHSEHQSGLAMDINMASDAFEGTPEAIWLAEHCSDYGFIIRYQKGKESITGFKYEPWHIRYLGVETAKAVEASGLSLEEYLGIDSVYKEDP